MAKAKSPKLANPTPDQYMALVGHLADMLDDAMDTVDNIRKARDLAMWSAREVHGKNVTHALLADSAKVSHSAARKILETVDAAIARIEAATGADARVFTSEGALPTALEAAGIESVDDLPEAAKPADDSAGTE